MEFKILSEPNDVHTHIHTLFYQNKVYTNIKALNR